LISFPKKERINGEKQTTRPEYEFHDPREATSEGPSGGDIGDRGDRYSGRRWSISLVAPRGRLGLASK